MVEIFNISHDVLGEYQQVVYKDIKEAGHRALASEGKFGWGMPTDPATQRFVKKTREKTVLEIGSGFGDTVVVPALKEGARLVFATDVVAGDLANESYMVQSAKALHAENNLKRAVLDPQWWNYDLTTNPTIRNILIAEPATELPDDGSIDQMIARHSLQFGSPETFLRFLDLASIALKPGGEVTGINFTPYTNYMFQYDGGLTMSRIMALNEEYAEGKVSNPGSFIHSERGPIKTSLARLMNREELDRGVENTFLYFDSPTLKGLMRKWLESREQRSLLPDLEIIEDFYFTPASIAAVNKLTDVQSLMNRENHTFVLRKI